MKILFIENAGHTSAGAFHALVVLMEKLNKRGIECHVALPDRADGIHWLDERSIPYIKMRECSYTQMISKNAPLIEKIKMPFKDNKIMRAAKKLAEYVKEHSIDLIHENTSACYIGKYVADIAGVKHIWHIRELLEEGYGSGFWKYDKAIENFNDSDKVITISNYIYNKYKSVINNDKLCRVYDGVDIQNFLFENRVILKDKIIKILVAGRVTENKSQRVVVEAVGILKEKYDIDVELTIAGLCSDEQHNKLMNIINKYHVEDKVKIVGQIDNIKNLYLEHDVLCNPAINEGFGLVTVEGMLSGCLVVGAISGATTEILLDEESEYGILFKSGDSEDLADKLKYVYENKDACMQLALKGQKRAVEEFDSEKNAEEIMEIYKEVLG